MIKKAAESSQTSAVKQASTREKRNRGLRLQHRNFRVTGVCAGHRVDADSGEAQQACRCTLHLGGGREEWGEVADEIANARAQADEQQRIAIARPLAQVRDQRDGEQAETRANQETKVQCWMRSVRGRSERKAAALEDDESDAKPQIRARARGSVAAQAS